MARNAEAIKACLASARQRADEAHAAMVAGAIGLEAYRAAVASEDRRIDWLLSELAAAR